VWLYPQYPMGPSDMNTLKVNEIYGPTVQGEGPSVGRQCAFLRLTGCNLTCSWCDTPYTWDWTGLNGVKYDKSKETRLMTVDDVWEQLRAYRVPLVVISGGEPMMQQDALAPLVESLTAQGVDVEIETNGTIKPSIKPTRFNVSPKLAHSGVTRKKAIKPVNLSAYVGQSIFKFVCQTLTDLDEVQAIADECLIPNEAIWIMPEGRDPITLQQHTDTIADAVIQRGWNITPRLHVMIWGHRRGV
jgi:7-carboxy-7-deazaguanine synthase